MAEKQQEEIKSVGLSNDLIALMLNRPADTSFRDSIDNSKNEIVEAAKNSKAIHDSYGNSLEAIGTDNPVEQFSHYDWENNTLNWTLWTALYNGSWVFKRAIDKPAQDEIRAGIEIQGQGDYSNIYRKMKKYRPDFMQLLQWGALYGGAIAVMMFDNLKDEDYKQKIDIKKVKQSKTMKFYVVDRWYGVSPSYNDTVTDMNDIDFGKPKFYVVTLADGHQVTFHHSFVLRYEHRNAPKFVKLGMLQGWGYAEGSHILDELSKNDKLRTSIQSLIDKSLIEVIKMAGMRGVFMGADNANEEQLRKRLEMVNWGRNFNSLTFLDKEDEYDQHTFSGMTGLSDLLQQNMWSIAAALEMQGVLFGDLKGGFSADEEALERYDETINNRCENFLRPVYEKFLSILYQIEGIDEKVEFEFKSLLTKQKDKESMEAMNNFVDLSSKLLNDGVITLKQYAQALQNYTMNHVIDFGLTDEAIDALDDKMAEEMENLDLSNAIPMETE